ncbi:hypothetical protein BCR37DRAFT_382854 [Protomyces lactucae-debilis]|uniref:Integral membrane bound transporter domain-containing protein n=1 Tax=Protomyces lactucae-debilis TaxID=2754530 RepID=A0A1Y2F303_PROLT|nr:uncharacterized protein BCR37DRAFT_382854 [Protomyces lactucae-debilis]ORY77345.1 hypothetical protein BCR37DRAFT_382854 [Protomyces lactucae-debilis]
MTRYGATQRIHSFSDEDSQDESTYPTGQAELRRLLDGPTPQASVILRDGRRVRRSITLSSLRERSENLSGEEDQSLLPSIDKKRSLFTRAYQAIQVTTARYSSRDHVALFKSLLAYFLASLVVFLPRPFAFLGTTDGKHFVATCCVYFHPARSQGAMLQATLYALLALAWSLIVSAGSMATAVGFNAIGQRNAGHVVVLVVWIVGGVGVIAYCKQRIGGPLIGVAASMASVVLFFNVTREGSLQLGRFNFEKLCGYLYLVLMGLGISILVNRLVMPVSATRLLKREMIQATAHMSQLLTLVTQSFLKTSGTDTEELQAAATQNGKTLAVLQEQLDMARYELCLAGREREYALLMDIVKKMTHVAQHLSGLLSSCEVQAMLLSGEADPESDTGSLTAREVARTYIHHLGPPIKSLAFTTRQALAEMPFAEAKFHVRLPVQLFENLDAALALYEEANIKALSTLYSHPVFHNATDLSQVTDREEVAASMEYFSHNLQAFVMETQALMRVLQALEKYQAQPTRSWYWLCIWRRQQKKQKSKSAVPARQKSWLDRVKYNLWRALRVFKNPNIRFGLKVGVGAALFATPSMVDAWRGVFLEYRFEWGLLSYVIITNASVGGTYSAALWRVTGSAIGTLLACFIWTAAPARAGILTPAGLVIATPCLWMILHPAKYNVQLGRFILLSYNLSALYAFTLSQQSKDGPDQDADEGGVRPIITLIAFHRIVSVTAGCIWGALINTYIWPIKARVALRQGLSALWLKLGHAWRQDPFGKQRTAISVEGFLAIRQDLDNLHGLLAQSPNEPRLRGPFPSTVYAQLLAGTRQIADLSYALTRSLHDASHASHTKDALLIQKTSQARYALADALFLVLYLLAGSLQVRAQVPGCQIDAAVAARERYLARISEVRVEAASARAKEGESALELLVEQEHTTGADGASDGLGASFHYALMTGVLLTKLRRLSVLQTQLFQEGGMAGDDLEDADLEDGGHRVA